MRFLMIKFMLIVVSVDDDNALRAKVDEAMNVYDEYVKNKGGDAEPPAGSGGKPEEPAKGVDTEEVKS